ncbi:MAG: hypothetical protein JW765_05820 [Deltaproteobacteria bacterium]|nr:hypothetical protein [Candidatus Zymogenaceae bacterium]
MKKITLIGLVGVLCIILLVIIACVRPILPGSSFEIVYPADGAMVPTEFSVLGVAASWSFGIETYPPLFLGAPKSHVALPPSMVQLSVDGIPYAGSSGGNHHVFRITAAPGDHTLSLTTPHGKTEITVHVTDALPVRFEPFDQTAEYMEAVNGLKRALYEFMQTSPSFSFSDDMSTYRFQRMFRAGDGAFVLFGAMKEQYLSACDIAYIPRISGDLTAGDIAGAPIIFSWNAAAWERPVKVATVDGGGDRLFLVIFDETTLTVFSVFPDGAARRSYFPHSAVAPGLAESVRTTFSPYILTRADRDTLSISLDTYQMSGPPGHFNILVRDGVAKAVDLGGKDVDGITPNGDLITIHPVSYIGPFDSTLIGDTGKTPVYLPLPDTGETFSFTGGSVHRTDEFTPEHPRFEIAPIVPCIGCTKDYTPPYWAMTDDVTFGPDVLKTTLGGHEEYFIIR